MKKNLKLLLLFCIVCGSFVSLQAEKGESSFTYLGEGRTDLSVKDFLVGYCSPNGRYMTATHFYGSVLAYDRVRDTFWSLGNQEVAVTAGGVSNDGTVVGSFTDPTLVVDGVQVTAAGYWTETGGWKRLPYPEGYKVLGSNFGGDGYGISADGKQIVGMMYKRHDPEFGNLKPIVQYVPAMWKWNDATSTYEFDKWFAVTKGWNTSPGGAPMMLTASGNMIVGWAIWDSNDIQYSLRTPMLWRTDTATYGVYGQPYYIPWEYVKGKWPMEEFVNANSQGDIVVGRIQDRAIYWTEKEGIVFLDPNPVSGDARAVSDSGTIVGVRNGAYIWSKTNGFLDLTSYAKEAYGLDLKGHSLGTATAISSDGKVIYGNTNTNQTYVLVLDGEKQASRPERVTVVPSNGGTHVKVTWSEPINNGMELLGYDVYRDDVKINTNRVVAPLREYIDSTVSAGNHCYAATAVFGPESAPKDSKKSPYSCIQVIDASTCYSVKSISSTVLHNQILTLTWGIPTPSVVFDSSYLQTPTDLFRSPAREKDEYAGQIPVKGDAIGGLPELDINTFADYIGWFPIPGQEGAITYMNEVYYIASFSGRAFNTYNRQGQLVEKRYSPIGPIQEMTTDGTYIYAVNKSDTIYRINPANLEVLERIKINAKSDHICFISNLDGGAGGFECGTSDASYLLRRDGSVIGPAMKGMYNMGSSVYHNGFIYTLEQSSLGVIAAEILEYKADETGKYLPTGLKYDFNSIPELVAFGEGYGAGMTLAYTEDGALCLVPIIQNPFGNAVVLIELEKPTGLIGYDVYRNDELIVDNYPYRNYQQILSEGTYVYDVRAVWEKGNGECTSDLSPKDTVKIEPVGLCNPPSNLKVDAAYNHIDISWTAPVKVPGQMDLVGYRIYDQEKEMLTKGIVVPQRYVVSVEDPGVYKYYVEAFYASSCSAFDSVEIEVNFEGRCLPVSNLKGSYDGAKGEVNLSWKAPYFDNPIAMRYDDGVFKNAMGVKDGGEFIGAIGWEKADITMYDDFEVIGFEVYIADRPKSLSVLVIVDDVYLVDQKVTVTGLKANTFNYIPLNKPIPFKANNDFAIGVRVDNVAGKYPLGIDGNMSRAKFSDLLSGDNGKTWTYLVDGNWLMAAYITKYREITPVTASAQLPGIKIGSPISEIKELPEVQAMMATKSYPVKAESKAKAFSLRGYELFKNGTRIESLPLDALSYNDASITMDETVTYKVVSVWNDCDPQEAQVEVMCVGMEQDAKDSFTLYPNPAQKIVHFQGTAAINRIQIFNTIGKEVYVQNNAASIDVSNFDSGLYIVKIQTANGSVTKKLNVVK